MGNYAGAHRFMARDLRQAGYRVACTELRGHGDSDTTFASYGDTETASDIIALIEALDGPAFIVGNSMAAGSAVCSPPAGLSSWPDWCSSDRSCATPRRALCSG